MRRLALFAVLAVLVFGGVLLTVQPVQAGMSGGKIRFRNDYIILKFEHTGSAVHHRAYIASGTYDGYEVFEEYANYLLEDDQLYQFAGSTDTDWSWTPVTTVTYEVFGTTVRWKIDQSLIERTCPFALIAVFEVVKPRNIKTIPPVRKYDRTCVFPTTLPTSTYTRSPTPLLTYTPTPTATHTPTSTPEK